MSPREQATRARWLLDADLARIVTRALWDQGVPADDIEDARQDVHVKALRALRRKVAPADLEEMKNLCVKIAEQYAIDLLRKADVRARDLVAGCRVEELAPLRSSGLQRDPVDAGRQLEVLAQLFREKKMPAYGVDILEGVACRCTWAEIAEPLKLNGEQARGRYRRMKATYRRRMLELGLLPGMSPLRLLASSPGVIARLRSAA